MAKPKLQAVVANGGQVIAKDGGWLLHIPSGDQGQYRLAQLDDYAALGRTAFPWQAGAQMSLSARASHATIPGTWGFGLWNDPFSLSLGLGGGTRRIPALPNAAWFFFASPPNYLSLRDDLPAQGALAATFRARPLPAALLAMAGLTLPLMAWPPTARLLRRGARAFVQQEAGQLDVDTTQWHTYSLQWYDQQVSFALDEQLVFECVVAPYAPLGLVLWIDNQFAALPPDGKLGMGTLENADASWIEIKELEIQPAA